PPHLSHLPSFPTRRSSDLVHYPGPDGKFGRTVINLVTSTNPLGLDMTDPDAKDDVVALNQLHLPVNRQAVIHVRSKDVIHSFKLDRKSTRLNSSHDQISYA